ncbi:MULTISPECIES: glycoside hydrolase family 3 N-terminal domain-containing protein [Chitinophagaceae]
MKIFAILSFSICTLPCFAQAKKDIYHKDYTDLNKNGKKDIYEDPHKPIPERIKDLISQMSLDEKAGQLSTLYGYGAVLKDRLPTDGWKDSIWRFGIGNIDEQLTGLRKDTMYAFPYTSHVWAINQIQKWFIENTRLGIPVDFTTEGIRGLNHMKATYFPSQLAQACTFDRELIYKIGNVTGQEARALNYTNVYSPILDVASDPRWGRIEESYGCDPYLVSQLGKQQILGIQKNNVVATAKHFAVYSVPIGGRDGNVRANPQVTPREMWEIYLEPFRVAFQEAGALGVMVSYNDYDGEPVIGSYHFLTEILRNAFKFSGYVVSDSEAWEYLFSKHHVAKNATEAAAMALHAGMNVKTNFTLPNDYIAAVKKAVQTGLLSKEDLDRRVSEVLKVKFQLGLFDPTPNPTTNQVETIVHNQKAQDLALEAAHKSIVLLKNKNNILPIQNGQYKSIAIIGPNANERKSLFSRYGPIHGPMINVYEGISEKFSPLSKIQYAKGIDHTDPHFPLSDIESFPLNDQENKMLDTAIQIAENADLVILVVGDNENTVGESKSRVSLKLPGHQEALAEAVLQLGKPCILIHVGGRPACMTPVYEKADAVLETFYLGEKTGAAIADILSGNYNPGGRLCVPILKDVGQIPLTFPHKLSDDAGGNASIKGFQYPFGFGLSYTTFSYSNLTINQAKTSTKDSIGVEFDIRNTGQKDGETVAQIYVRDSIASLVPYEKRLKEFRRIFLRAGEQKHIQLKLPMDAFSMYNKDYKRVVEAGDFIVMVGESSEDIRLRTTISLEEKML